MIQMLLKNIFLGLRRRCNYGTASVKTANRKRIALAVKTLSKLNPEEKANIFSYNGEYCPDLKTKGNVFSVSSEDELKFT